MRLKRGLKLVILISCITLTLIMFGMMYYLIFEQNTSFNYRMLFVLFMAFTGLLSVLYHLKTLKYYKLNIKLIEVNNISLWVINILFALFLVYASLYLSYSLYSVDWGMVNYEFFIPIFICLFMLMLGVVLIIEERWLYQRIKNNKTQSHIDGIDNIKGHQDNDL